MSIADVFSKIAWSVGFNANEVTIGDGSPFSSQLLSIMNEAGDDIARRADWTGLMRSQSYGPNLTSAPLPTDFHRLSENGPVLSAANDGRYEPFRIILAPGYWELLRARPSAQPYFHMANGEIHFSPDSGPDGAIMRYQSRFWIDQDKPQLTAGTDTIRFPEHILHRNAVWRWRRQKGLDYADLIAEYEADLAEAVSSDRGT